MKTFVIDANKLLTQGCIVENSKLLKYDIESDDQTRVAGNIYKGRITNVNRQKRIGFIDIGLDKNAMINLKDVTKDVALVAGQDVLVQVISDPYEEKGAKLTTELSFQGKFMVLLSGGTSVGVSRKIESEEKRNFLTEKIASLIGPNETIDVIVRTDAAKASLDDLVSEFNLLKNQLNEMLSYRVLGKAPRLLREQKGIIDQYAKLFNPAEDKWITNDLETSQYSIDLLGKKSVQYYAGHDLFDYVGCSQDIQRIKAYKIALPSGGELVVDYTEACTVIDVNSGKQRKNTPAYDILYKINCEAMEMTRWLLEKGNIGGAIIIDLINMKEAHKQNQLIDSAKKIFKGSDCYVAGMSALGFLEITRKRVIKPAHKVFEFQRPKNDDKLYELNTLFYLNQFINEVRRLAVHHSGRHYKFLASPEFSMAIAENELLSKEGKFYENKDVTVEIIDDVTLKTPFKITY